MLPAGYLSVINGMVPLWTAVFAASVLKEPLARGQIAGFVARRRRRRADRQPRPGGAELAHGLGGRCRDRRRALWGWAGVIIKQRSGHVPPIGLAAGSITARR